MKNNLNHVDTSSSLIKLAAKESNNNKKEINPCSKPVFNLKTEYLHKILLSCLKKLKDYNFQIMPIIMDGASMNVKVTRILLKELSSKTEGKLTPI